MQQNPLDFDSVALKARLVQRHGSDLGMLVYAAEESRRRTQDERYVELSTELTALQANISVLRHAAGEWRAGFQTRLAAAYAGYLALCAEDAKADSEAQAKIAPLAARSRDVQEQMRHISLPRQSERELHDLAVYSSSNSERLRSVDRKFPPLEAPPLSALGKINAGVGLSKVRS
jgi:hypothetical protein